MGIYISEEVLDSLVPFYLLTIIVLNILLIKRLNKIKRWLIRMKVNPEKIKKIKYIIFTNMFWGMFFFFAFAFFSTTFIRIISVFLYLGSFIPDINILL